MIVEHFPPSVQVFGALLEKLRAQHKGEAQSYAYYASQLGATPRKFQRQNFDVSNGNENVSNGNKAR